jgi:hypothetical protein
MSIPGEGNGTVTEDRAASLLAGFRAQHKVVKRETTEKIAIPGAPWLLAEYEVIDWEDERELEKRALGQDHGRRELNYYIDQLLTACVGFHVKDGDSVQALDPEQPIRYDERLLKGLGITLEDDDVRAREILYAVFAEFEENPKKVPYRINAHHTEFVQWMSGSPDEQSVEAGFLGE